jgi:hypothetical protein
MSMLMAVLCFLGAGGMCFILQKILNPAANLPYGWVIRSSALVQAMSMLVAGAFYLNGSPAEPWHVLSQASYAVFIWWVILFHVKGHAVRKDWGVW